MTVLCFIWLDMTTSPWCRKKVMVHTGIAMVQTKLWLLELTCVTLGLQYVRSLHEIIIWLKTFVISGKFNINHYWGYAALQAVPGSCLRNTGVTSQWLWACDWPVWIFLCRIKRTLWHICAQKWPISHSVANIWICPLSHQSLRCFKQIQFKGNFLCTLWIRG